MARILGIFGGLVIWMAHRYGYARANPTDGFIPQKLTAATFEIQKPYDKAESERYSFVDGVHSLWVYKNDKPHLFNSNTSPRTEIRIRGYDYTSGLWQFEGDMYVPRGTTGVSVMQVFWGIDNATSLMLHVYDGQLKRYNAQVVASDVYDKWIHLNVIHDTDQGKVSVFVDGQEKLVADDRGRATHFFKCGVSIQRNSSSCVETRWKIINVWSQKNTKTNGSFLLYLTVEFDDDQ